MLNKVIEKKHREIKKHQDNAEYENTFQYI